MVSSKKIMTSAIPLILVMLFLGTAITPFLSANTLQTKFGGETDLTDPLDSTVKGSVGRYFEDGTYDLNISATLSDPEEGYGYTAWLIRLSPFSTMNLGTLQKNETSWNLSYQSQDSTVDFEGYTEIIITKEALTGAAIPNETHILEASFS